MNADEHTGQEPGRADERLNGGEVKAEPDGRAPATQEKLEAEQKRDEQARRARELRAHDAAYWTHKRIADELGVSDKMVARWVARDSGPKPRKRSKAGAKPKPENVKARTQAIEAALAQVLVFPAVPSMMLAPTPEGRAFLAAHFTSAGPRTAHQLAVASEQAPELRELLENLTKGSVRATIAFAVIGYAGPPLLWLFGMQGLAVGVSQAGGLDETELASMFTVTDAAGPIIPEPPEPDGAQAPPQPPSPSETPAG